MQVADGFAAKLAERKGLTPAQIRTAVRFAGLAASSEKTPSTHAFKCSANV